MSLTILCPNCRSKSLEQHPNPTDEHELICLDCGAEISLAHIQYENDY